VGDVRRSEGGFLLSKVHQLMGRVFNRLLREHGIEFNSAQGRILFVLWKGDGIPITELAEETMLGKSTLTSMLDRLEEAGHIRRERSPEDRRVTLIRLVRGVPQEDAGEPEEARPLTAPKRAL
jgi:DNA-binding MarR family transcriptional regulator